MYVKDDFGYKKRVKRRSKRPAFLAAVCLLFVLWGFWHIISMFVKVYPGVYTLYPAANALMVVFSFVAISGTWSMEKWGPVSFVIVVALKILVDLIFNQFNPWYLTGFVLAGFFLLYLPKMKQTE